MVPGGGMSRGDRHLSEPHIAHPILQRLCNMLRSLPPDIQLFGRSSLLFLHVNFSLPRIVRHPSGSQACAPVAAVPSSPTGLGTAIQMTRGPGQTVGTQHSFDIGYMRIWGRILYMMMRGRGDVGLNAEHKTRQVMTTGAILSPT